MKKRTCVFMVTFIIIVIVLLAFAVKLNGNSSTKIMLNKEEKINSPQKSPYKIEQGEIEGVVFQSSYSIDFLFNGINRWDLQEREVNVAEKILKDCLEKEDAEISSKYSKYRRQYFGLIENNKKIIWINAFIDDSISNWEDEVVVVLDGGNNFFNAKIDLSGKKCLEIKVNGIS